MSNYFCLLPESLVHCYVSEVIFTFTSIHIKKIYDGFRLIFKSIGNINLKKDKRISLIKPRLNNTINDNVNPNITFNSKALSEETASFYSCVSFDEKNDIQDFQDSTIDQITKNECADDINGILHYYSQKRVFFTINSITILLPDPRPMMTSHLDINITNICYLHSYSGKNCMNYLTVKDISINDKIESILNFRNSSINTSMHHEDNYCLSYYSNEWNEKFLLSFFELNHLETLNEIELSNSIYSSRFIPHSLLNKPLRNEGIYFCLK